MLTSLEISRQLLAKFWDFKDQEANHYWEQRERGYWSNTFNMPVISDPHEPLVYSVSLRRHF